MTQTLQFIGEETKMLRIEWLDPVEEVISGSFHRGSAYKDLPQGTC